MLSILIAIRISICPLEESPVFPDQSLVGCHAPNVINIGLALAGFQSATTSKRLDFSSRLYPLSEFPLMAPCTDSLTGLYWEVT
jgi:hypothetical protein